MMSSSLGSSRKITVMAMNMNALPTSGIISATLPKKWYSGMDRIRHR